MKTFLLSVVLLCLAWDGIAQPNSLVGAWIWNDGNKEISIFMKKEGSIKIHSGEQGGVIQSKDLRTGRYTLIANLLSVKWADNTDESFTIKFVDKNTFIIEGFDKISDKKNKKLTFKKVIDEEG